MRRRLTPRSLRARLIAGVLALSAISLIALMAALYAEQHQFLYDRVDAQAKAAVFPVNRELNEQGIAGGPVRSPRGPEPATPGRPPGPAGGSPQELLPPGTFGQRRSATGEVLGTVLLGVGNEQPSPPKLPATLTDGALITVPSVSGSLEYRVFVSGGPEGTTTVTAVPLTDVREQLNRLLGTALLLIGSGLLLTGLFGWWLITFALRPLDAMGRTAGAIADGDLSQRVTPDDTETEIGTLGHALNTMLGQIEQSFAAQQASEEQLRRFLADASHELRTPLSSIRGYAELHRMGAASDPGAVEHAMSRIEAESARMGVLVEDLLKLARLDERREPVRQPVSMTQLAADAVSDAQAADQTGRVIGLQSDGDAPVLGDPDDLRQVLANLLRNAVTHTPPGTPIEVTVAQDAGTVRLIVRDHGPGLPTEDGSQLFERFWRAAPGRERGPAGAGLGLAIVAGIVDAHGGRVRAEQADGGGAAFIVELPSLPEAAA